MKAVAGALIALVAASVVVGLWWVGVATAWFPLTGVNVDRGARLFQSRCALCHSTEPGSGSSRGPTLDRIGESAGRRILGMSAEEFLLQSIQYPAAYREPGEDRVMPADVGAGLTREEILSLVGFLTTRRGSLAMDRLMRLQPKVDASSSTRIATVDLAAAESGRKLFFTKGKCDQCHTLRDVPGSDLRAPTLIAAGHHNATYLRESIREPSKHIVPKYTQWNIQLTSGRQIQGQRMRQSSESVDVLINNAESFQIRTIPLDEIEQLDDGQLAMIPSPASQMPDYSPSDLTDAELEQILVFLRTLR